MAAATAIVIAPGPAHAQPVPEDWLSVLNSYRFAAGLQTVTEDPALSAAATKHACYMQQNNVSTHTEDPPRPGYSVEGNQAGQASVLAQATPQEGPLTDRMIVERLLAAPVHGMTMMAPYTARVGLGRCSGLGGLLAESYAIDVTSGVDYTVATPSDPQVFPSSGSTVRLNSYGGEWPELASVCPAEFTKPVNQLAVPVWVQFPQPFTGAASVSWVRPDGSQMPVCTVTDANAPAVGKPYLGPRGVVVFGLDNQATGTHQLAVSAGGQTAQWSYRTDPSAGLMPWAPRSLAGTAATSVTWAGASTMAVGPLSQFDPVVPFRFADSRLGSGMARLAPGAITRLQVAGAQSLPGDVSALSANFTAAGATGASYLTVFDCSTPMPTVSTVNFPVAVAVPNQAVVPLDSAGGLCLFSPVAVDVIVDVNGVFRAAGAQKFTPVSPFRVADTRPSVPVAPGTPLRVQVASPASGVPAGAAAVALNVTATESSADGWLRVVPCDGASSVSNVNFVAGQTVANSVMVSTSPGGEVCVETFVATHVIVDVTGFLAADGFRFQALKPARMFDTRQAMWPGDPRFVPSSYYPWKLTGLAGIPATARAVSVNVTAADPGGWGYLTGWECGQRPNASTVNYVPPATAVANGAMLKLSPTGEMCLFASAASHVVVDINGVWL